MFNTFRYFHINFFVQIFLQISSNNIDLMDFKVKVSRKGQKNTKSGELGN